MSQYFNVIKNINCNWEITGEKKFPVRFEPSTKITHQLWYSCSLLLEPPERFLAPISLIELLKG